jgi:tRNA threonylcarbamoyladenosine biosynthesis protein TsaE
VATRAGLDIVSHGVDQTRRLGAHLGRLLAPGDVILLDGEFGSGKTTFTQGIAKGLGLDSHYVNSPTFTLINEYKGGRVHLAHIDLYRLQGASDVSTLGLDDYLEGPGATVIEWPAQAEATLPQDRLLVEFDYLNDTKRTLRFFAFGERYEQLLEAFKKAAFG